MWMVLLGLFARDSSHDTCCATTTAAVIMLECMCHWQHKDGCVGSKCQYQMGLSWYHYSCKDCRCVQEP